jgi:hypothetical protein
MQTLEQKRAWRIKNREKIKQKKREWEKANPDKVRAYKKIDYLRHKEHISQKHKEYNIKNLERIKKRKRDYYHANRDEQLKKRREFRANNPGKIKQWRQNNRINNRASSILSGIKKTCKTEGIEFGLTKEWIQKRLDIGVCELSGIAFDMEGKRTRNSPSVDRINPAGSYTPGNCRFVVWSLNRALSNYGQEYMFSLFEEVLKKQKPEIFI